MDGCLRVCVHGWLLERVRMDGCFRESEDGWMHACVCEDGWLLVRTNRCCVEAWIIEGFVVLRLC